MGVRIRVCLTILWPISTPHLRGYIDSTSTPGPRVTNATYAPSGLSPVGILPSIAITCGATLPRPSDMRDSETRSLRLAENSRSAEATRGLLEHSMAQRTSDL